MSTHYLFLNPESLNYTTSVKTTSYGGICNNNISWNLQSWVIWIPPCLPAGRTIAELPNSSPKRANVGRSAARFYCTFLYSGRGMILAKSGSDYREPVVILLLSLGELLSQSPVTGGENKMNLMCNHAFFSHLLCIWKLNSARSALTQVLELTANLFHADIIKSAGGNE